MNTIKSIIQEGLGMLNPNSIPVFLFQLFLLVIVVVLVKMAYKWKSKEPLGFPLMSLALSLGILMPFVKYSNAMAIVMLGGCVLLAKAIEVKKEELPFLAVGLATALAVSSGFWVLGLMGWSVAMIVLLLLKK